MRALFLDRDGIINVRPPQGDYVKSLDEFQFQEAIFPVLRELGGRGYKLFVVTNQRGVALGLMSESDLVAIHDRMLERLAEEQIKIEQIYVCIHAKDSCDCRKPKPGMILQAESDFEIDLVASALLGDNLSDLEAARAAGVSQAFLYDPESRYPEHQSLSDFHQLLKLL